MAMIVFRCLDCSNFGLEGRDFGVGFGANGSTECSGNPAESGAWGGASNGGLEMASGGREEVWRSEEGWNVGFVFTGT